MPLECTVIGLDNSEWMRNGDYHPNRMTAQRDAAALLSDVKLQDNPENTVAILAHAGKNVEVLASPTSDMAKIFDGIHGIDFSGKCDFVAGCKIGALALKHRPNRHGGSRIVMFVGSPVEATEKELKKVAVALKKTNVAVDVILMGENDTNRELLTAFIEKVSKDDNSHLLEVPPGSRPTELMMTSAICGGGGGGGAAAGGPGGAAGGDELQMALRMSLEEARARNEGAGEAEGAGAGGAAAAGAAPADGGDGLSAEEQAMIQAAMGASMDDDDELQRAIALSMMAGGEAEGGADGAAAAAPSPAPAAAAATEAAPADAPAPADTPAEAPAAEGIIDADFAAQLLGDLQGVDLDDPAVQAALAEMQGGGGGGGSGGAGGGGAGSGGSGGSGGDQQQQGGDQSQGGEGGSA